MNITTPNQALMAGRRRQVQEMWLEGQRPAEIALSMGLSVSQVSSDIKTIREELYQENQVAIQEHAEQSIAVLRRLEGRLWSEVEVAENTGDRLKAYEQIRKTEESIGKVRGLLSNKVVADVFHHVKMYDFEDALPAPMVIDAEPNKVTKTPDSSKDVAVYLAKPDFEETKPDTTLMPDGSWIDAVENAEWKEQEN